MDHQVVTYGQRPPDLLLDTDPVEIREGLEGLQAVAREHGDECAHFLRNRFREQPQQLGVVAPVPPIRPRYTSVSNGTAAIPCNQDREADHRRWNALVMVVHANAASGRLGGHAASHASAAEVFGWRPTRRPASSSPSSRAPTPKVCSQSHAKSQNSPSSHGTESSSLRTRRSAVCHILAWQHRRSRHAHNQRARGRDPRGVEGSHQTCVEWFGVRASGDYAACAVLDHRVIDDAEATRFLSLLADFRRVAL
jgi:hypothetical protein